MTALFSNKNHLKYSPVEAEIIIKRAIEETKKDIQYYNIIHVYENSVFTHYIRVRKFNISLLYMYEGNSIFYYYTRIRKIRIRTGG